MTKEECKQKILQEWERWAPNPNFASYDEMREFFLWLESNHLELLGWRRREGDDGWQTVRGWLNVRTNYGHRG